MDTTKFQSALLAEKKKLEEELPSVSHKNPSNPSDWEPTPEKTEEPIPDPNDMADVFEDFETKSSITENLEFRLSDVNLALGKIKKGTYGTCEVCNASIEEERLTADPAARTCIVHKETKL